MPKQLSDLAPSLKEEEEGGGSAIMWIGTVPSSWTLGTFLPRGVPKSMSTRSHGFAEKLTIVCPMMRPLPAAADAGRTTPMII